MNFFSSAVAFWDRFWFARRQTLTLDIFRILFGFFQIVTFTVLYPNWERFYGAAGSLPLEAFSQHYYTFSLFSLSQYKPFVWLIYWLAMAAAFAYMLGFRARWAAFVLYLIHLSMVYRNATWSASNEGLTITLLFFSIFSPVGAHFSLDALQRRYRYFLSTPATPPPPSIYPLWSVRLMQVSICFLYFFAGLSKYIYGDTWLDGSAIYYVTLSERWFRFPAVSFFHNFYLSRLLTYGTLILELTFPFVVWLRSLRFISLLTMMLFHLQLVVLMGPGVLFINLLMPISLLLFVEPETWQRILSPRHGRSRVYIFYDGACILCRRTVAILKAVDVSERVYFYDFRDQHVSSRLPQYASRDLSRTIHLFTESGELLVGFWVYRRLTLTIPMLFPLAIFFYFPGAAVVGPKLYDFIARRRALRGACQTCHL